jgi:hypothetical protein
VPPFSGTWILTTPVISLVCFIRLTISRVSLWPFPGFYNKRVCFFIHSIAFLGMIHFMVVFALIVWSYTFSTCSCLRWLIDWLIVWHWCETLTGPCIVGTGVICLVDEIFSGAINESQMVHALM